MAAWLGLAVLLAAAGCRLYVHLMGALGKPCSDPLAGLEQCDLTLDPAAVQNSLAGLVDSLNAAATALRGLLLLQDKMLSVKFGLALYCAAQLGSLANTLTLLTLAWLAAFTLPTLYNQNKQKVDELVDLAMAQYEAAITKLCSLLPASAPAPEKSE